MRRAGILVCLLLALGSTATSAAERSPRLERLALTPADNRLAAGAQVRKSDLAGIPPGWLPLSTTPDNAAPVCSWQDYAAYTLTGRAEADFQPTKVGHAGFVGSSVDILATPADANGKFTVDTHPGTGACEAEALRKAFGSSLKTTSARQLKLDNLGDHAVGYAFAYEQPNGTPKRIYVTIIEFVEGRGIATLSTTDFDTNGSMATRLTLAHLIDKRLS